MKWICFEVYKIKLAFNMSRHHIPETASRYWERSCILGLPFKSGADKARARSSLHVCISNKHLGKVRWTLPWNPWLSITVNQAPKLHNEPIRYETKSVQPVSSAKLDWLGKLSLIWLVKSRSIWTYDIAKQAQNFGLLNLYYFTLSDQCFGSAIYIGTRNVGRAE